LDGLASSSEDNELFCLKIEHSLTSLVEEWAKEKSFFYRLHNNNKEFLLTIIMMDQTRTIQTELIANKKNDLQQVLLKKYVLGNLFFVKRMFYRSSIFAE
jgi:ABC-type enterochelin transport system permease subunit